MSDRQQNISPRARKPAARPKRGAPVASNRRKSDPRRWFRLALIGMAIIAPVAAVAVIARSEAFALRRVDVVGAKRTSAEKIEQLVRKASGDTGIFSLDLDEIRKSVESERYVRTAAVVRVLPDTILVRIEEREPAIVARLASGKLVWVDTEAHVLDEYRAERGATVPPPLAGFEDGDTTDRVTAENRDRIAAYEKIREALAPDDLWNRIDEVDLRFIKDASVQLADNAIVVRLGGNGEDRAVEILEGLNGRIPAPVEGYKKDDSPDFCVQRLAALIGEQAEKRESGKAKKSGGA